MNKTISKVTALLAALVVAVCAMPAAVSADSTTLVGSGTEKDPYVVTTAAQLQELNKEEEVRYVQLGNNIDMKDVELINKTYVIKKLTGEFDGNGYTISNLSLEGNSDNGYFSYTYHGFVSELSGTIKDLIIDNAEIKNVGKSNYAGILAGIITESGTGCIDNCIVSGKMNCSTGNGNTLMGGLVGRIYGIINKPATIKINNCISNVAISGASSTYCGGIIGSAQSFSNVNISNCSILGDISGNGYVGGVVGFINNANVSLNLSNTLLCSKMEGSNKYGISRNSAKFIFSVKNFYYDTGKNAGSFDMFYDKYPVDSTGCTGKTTTEMQSLKLDGFAVVEGEYNGYPVPVWKTSGGDEPITYSITLDDSKIKAVVSAAKTDTYCVVFASYNGDTLISVDVVKHSFTASADQTVTASDKFNATGATTVKAMLLRSFEDIYPLCEAAQK